MSAPAECKNCDIVEDDDYSCDSAYDNVINFPTIYQEQLLRSTVLSEELRVIYYECKEDNWDAQNAAAIPYKAIEEALYFIDSLPEEIPLPDEITPSSDGSIDLEWYENPRCIFNALIYGDDKIVYAGMFGEIEKHNGILPLEKESYQSLLPHIKRVKHAR